MIFRKPITGAVLFCLLSPLLHAQQTMQYSQFMLNPAAYNTGYTGTEDALSASFQYRTQWTGLPGHPVLQEFNVNTPLSWAGWAAGIFVNNETAGALRNTEAELALNRLSRAKKFTLGYGLRFGLMQVALDGDKLRAPDGDYSNGQINHNDGFLPVSTVSALVPDASAGVVLRSKRIQIGLAANHVTGLKAAFKVENNILDYTLSRSYVANASYLFPVGRKLSLRFSGLVKYETPLWQTEWNGLLYYKKLFWVGLGYRGHDTNSQDAVSGYAGIHLTPELSIGYSYDYTLSALQTANNGSHEVLLSYRLSLTRPYKPGKFIFTPRF